MPPRRTQSSELTPGQIGFLLFSGIGVILGAIVIVAFVVILINELIKAVARWSRAKKLESLAKAQALAAESQASPVVRSTCTSSFCSTSDCICDRLAAARASDPELWNAYDVLSGNFVIDIDDDSLANGQVRDVTRHAIYRSQARDVTLKDGELCGLVRWADGREDWRRVARLALVRYISEELRRQGEERGKVIDAELREIDRRVAHLDEPERTRAWIALSQEQRGASEKPRRDGGPSNPASTVVAAADDSLAARAVSGKAAAG